VGGGIQLDPIGTEATNRRILPAPGDYDDGEIDEMIGRRNRSTRRKPAPMQLCLPQTPHAVRTRTPAAAVGSQRLTVWATARPSVQGIGSQLCSIFIYSVHFLQGLSYFKYGNIFKRFKWGDYELTCTINTWRTRTCSACPLRQILPAATLPPEWPLRFSMLQNPPPPHIEVGVLLRKGRRACNFKYYLDQFQASKEIHWFVQIIFIHLSHMLTSLLSFKMHWRLKKFVN
jgi:hypothetical protein